MTHADVLDALAVGPVHWQSPDEYKALKAGAAALREVEALRAALAAAQVQARDYHAQLKTLAGQLAAALREVGR